MNGTIRAPRSGSGIHSDLARSVHFSAVLCPGYAHLIVWCEWKSYEVRIIHHHKK